MNFQLQSFLGRLSDENQKKQVVPEKDVALMTSSLPQLHSLHGTGVLPKLQYQLEQW